MSAGIVPSEHGTPARYRGNPRRGVAACRCEPCRTAERRRKKRAAVVGDLTVDAAPAAAHIHALFAGGASHKSIARTVRCGINTVRQIADGTRPEIWASTRNRLLAVESAPDVRLSVPAIGATRRVRALMALGHPVADIQAAAGISGNLVARLVSGEATGIWARSAVAVGEAYGRLSMTAGASGRSRGRAVREGWAPPLAWDDIDDPRAVPCDWRRTAVRRAEDVVEDAEFVRRTVGGDRNQIAERLGTTHGALDAAYSRTAQRQAAVP